MPVGRERTVETQTLTDVDVEQLERPDGLLEEAPEERLAVERSRVVNERRFCRHFFPPWAGSTFDTPSDG